MAYAFGGGSGMPKVKVWIVDEDKSERSQQFEKTLRASSMLECLPRAGDVSITRDELKQKVVDGDAHHGLVIPAGFGAHDKSTVPDLDMLRDPGRAMEDRILQFSLVQALLGAGDGTLWKQSLQRWIKAEGATDKELQQFSQIYDTAEATIRTGVTLLSENGLGDTEPIRGGQGDTNPAMATDDRAPRAKNTAAESANG